MGEENKVRKNLKVGVGFSDLSSKSRFEPTSRENMVLLQNV